MALYGSLLSILFDIYQKTNLSEHLQFVTSMIPGMDMSTKIHAGGEFDTLPSWFEVCVVALRC